MDLNKSLKDIKGSKITLFNESDKKFLKTEMKKELLLMKSRLKDNAAEITKMVVQQKHMIKGSKEELDLRKQIIDSYKTQAKLSKEMGDLQKTQKNLPGTGGPMDFLGGRMGGIMGKIGGAIGLGALATAAMALTKSVQATHQYVSGVGNRVKLKGLGVGDENFGSAQQLARVGLSEQEMIQRRIEATSVLGRGGTSNAMEMRKAGFERAFGLQGGTMTGVAGQLRGQAGGAAASDVQMKLQASILASGIEDAIGPYLQTATKLLTDINEDGNQNTTQVIGLLSQLTKDGQRTPEAIGKMFSTINGAVKGASGESSAFLQTAFARAGIGGGTLGGTKFAMESGGIMGLNKEELSKRGYNPQLLANMEKSGMFSGMGQRSGAILEQFKRSGGLKAGQKIGDVTGTSQMIGLNRLANNVFGTKGNQGFETLQMLEKVQNKQMSQKSFDEKLKKMQEETPETKRLDDINASLAGQTEILTNINTNLMEALGKEGAQVRNVGVGLENQGLENTTGLAKSINDTGFTKSVGGGLVGAAKYIGGGGIGEDLATPYNERTSAHQKIVGAVGDNFGTMVGVLKEIKNLLSFQKSKPTIIKNHMPDGKITERTTK